MHRRLSIVHTKCYNSKMKDNEKIRKVCMKRICLFLLGVLLCASLFACASKQSAPQATPASTDNAASSSAPVTDETQKVTAKMDMGEYGIIELELYPDVAPQSVYNFCYLARQGYYDGLIFHRVIKDFMIQGGDPTGTGMGGSGYCIKGEFGLNGFSNSLSHSRGVISMARAQAMDSGGSQFFIVHKDHTELDGSYAAFGRVIDGMETVDRIANIRTGADDRPYKDIVIQSVTIEGPELPEPEKLPEA